MSFDQTTQAKSGPAEVSSQMLAPSQLRKRSSTTAMREDEHPQEAEHIQKRANIQTDQTTEMDDEMAKMVQKHKEDVEKTVKDKISTKGWVQRKPRQRRTASCCSCQKRTMVSKSCECHECGQVLCSESTRD